MNNIYYTNPPTCLLSNFAQVLISGKAVKFVILTTSLNRKAVELKLKPQNIENIQGLD